MGGEMSNLGPFKTSFARIFRYLDEIEAYVEEKEGYFLPRHAHSKGELLRHKYFDKIETICRNLESTMREWEIRKENNPELTQHYELVSDYYSEKCEEMEDKLSSIRTQIISRRETLGDALVRMAQNFIDAIIARIARILRLPESVTKQLTYRRRDDDDDDEDC
jgi:hypothetical protein